MVIDVGVGVLQETLHEKLQAQTVITIAHRIDTIMHSDRVVVLQEGKVIEDGDPAVLQHRPGSVFKDIVASSQAS